MRGGRLLIAGGLLSFLLVVWFVGEGGDTKQEERLFSFTPDQVGGVTLERPDAPIIGIERMGDRWFMMRPLQTNTDKGEVDGIVAAATSAPIEKRIGHVDDLVPFGLDRPVKVTFLLQDGSPAVVRIGGLTPDQSLRYVAIGEGNEVLAVARSVGAALYRNLFELRDKRLLPIKSEEVERIVVEGTPDTVVERGDTGWVMTAPYETPVSLPHVSAILATLANLRAAGFYDTPEEIDAARPTTTRNLRLTDAGKENLVAIGEAPHGVGIVIIDGRVARIAPDRFGALPTGPSDFLDLRLLPGAEEHPAKIEYRTGEMSVTLVAEGEKWNVTEPVREPADRTVVDALLHHLAGTAGDRYVAATGFDPKTFGFDTPFAQATVTDTQGNSRTVTIGTIDDRFFVTATHMNGVATINEGVARTLFPPAPPVDRRLFPVEAVGVKRIAVDRLGQRFVVESGERGGVMTSPKEMRLNDEPYYRFVWGILSLAYGNEYAGPTPTDEPVAMVEVWGMGDKPVNRVSFFKPAEVTEGYLAVDQLHARPLRVDGRMVTTELVTLLEMLMESTDE